VFRIAAVRFVHGRFAIFAATLNGNDRLIARQKFAGNVDRLIKQTAGVVPQVQDQLSRAVFFQLRDRFAQFVVGRVLKSADQTDISRAGTDHEGVANRRKRNRVANDLKVKRDFFAGPLDLDVHRTQTIAAHVPGNFFAGPFPRIFAVDLDDAISGSETGARSGCVFYYRLNVDAVVVTKNLNADAVE